MAKRLVGSQESQTEGQTPAELALVSDLQTLTKQRAQEKKAAQHYGAKLTQSVEDMPRPAEEPCPNKAPDAETERVLRFLHG
jgi:hypothetical protein